MRALYSLLLPIAVVAAGPVLAQSMANMPGMKHAAAPAKSGHGSGVITAIDAKAGKLTIKHGPIAAIGWPAMTMPFKANPPALLHGLRVGQKIDFDVKVIGSAAEVTAIRQQ